MKIGFVVSEFPSLTQTFVVDKAETLLQRGHDVRIFTWEKKKVEKLHPVFQRIQWQKRTHYLRSYYHQNYLSRLSRLGLRLISSLLRSPSETGRFLNRIRKKPLSFKEKIRLAAVYLPFVGYDLDAFHVHLAWAGRQVEQLGEMLQRPLVVSVMGADITLVKPKQIPSLDLLLQSSDRILCLSRFLKDHVTARGIPEERVRIQPIEIDCDFFSPASDRPSQSRNEIPTILTVCRLHWKKGLLDGLYALAALRDKGVPFRWQLVGTGPEKDALQGAVLDLKLTRSVEFVGPLSRTEVRDAMRRADLFFLPSVREEFGAVLAEAQACATPVVATRAGGIPEVVQERQTGYLAQPRNALDMAEKLAALLTLPDRGRSLGAKGRERALQLFDRRRLDAQLLQHYRDVVAENSKSPHSTPPTEEKESPLSSNASLTTEASSR